VQGIKVSVKISSASLKILLQFLYLFQIYELFLIPEAKPRNLEIHLGQLQLVGDCI
jgi:hypothetical protein